MIDTNTFLTILYVMIDDFCKSRLPREGNPLGRKASLSPSEVMTLAIFSQWYPFRGQRDFYRRKEGIIRAAFPKMPSRPQFNRLVRAQQESIIAFYLYLVECLRLPSTIYEVLDTTGVPVRNVKRRGRGWLAGQANVGWCTRLGWFNGFQVLMAVTREGVITGYGFGAGSAKEQPMAEIFFGLRCYPQPGFLSVGKPFRGYSLADKGFAGPNNHRRWLELFGTHMICEPQTNSKPWPFPWRLWLKHYRQIVETAYAKLLAFFRLADERPHDLSGFQVNLAAKMTLHNFCIWLNRLFGRPSLAFADLLLW